MSGWSNNLRLGGLGSLLVIAGAFNNVTGKIRSKPLGAYDYFVSLANSVVYSIVYLSILLIRWRSNPNIGQNIKFIFTNPISSSSTATFTSEGVSSLRPLWNAFVSMWRTTGPWKLIVICGFCDSIGNILGFIAQPYVAGSIYSLMSQCVVLFTALVSMICLGTRYTLWQALSVVVVAIGAIAALAPELTPTNEGGGSCPYAGECGAQADADRRAETIFFAAMVAVSTLPTAVSFVVKEMIFTQYRTKRSEAAMAVPTLHPPPTRDFCTPLRGAQRPTQLLTSPTATPVTGDGDTHVSQTADINGDTEMDIFVVAALVSMMQILFVPLALPLNRLSGHVHGDNTLSYFRDSLSCMIGVTPDSCTIMQANCAEWGCCKYAPGAYGLYIISNLAYNTCILAVLRMATALFSFVCLKAVLPASIVLFVIFPWPLLSKEDIGVTGVVVISLLVVLVGIFLFNASTNQSARLVQDGYFRDSGGRLNAQPPCLWPLTLCPARRYRDAVVAVDD
eukprot:Lankesteria_metandrocarpae@DN5036_c0_g1_i10.p1